MRPSEFAVCEIGEDGEIAYVLDLCTTETEALEHATVYAAAPAGDIHRVDGCVAVYRLVCCRPGAPPEAGK